jgi:starvation-inducible outer membrane lipoprotein
MENPMNPIKTSIIILLSTLYLASCASTPPPPVKQGSSADTQKSNARRAQDELTRETSEKK